MDAGFTGVLSLIIAHNLLAINSQNQLRRNEKKSTEAIEKLSSGLRINKAADDAAGLAISEKMRAQIRGLSQAARNVQDSISLIQTAEGGLANIQDPPLLRMRELVIQAANDTLTSSDRQSIQQEIESIKQEIDEIANGTEFNNIKLLNQPSKILVESVSQNISTVNNVTTTSQVSPPNINWTKSNSFGQFLDVCYNGSRYVAVGRDGDMAYSDDGATWHSVSSSPSYILIDLKYGNGKFVAVGHDGGIVSSTDGITWNTSITNSPNIANFSDWSINSLAFDGSKFVATATDWGGTEKFLSSTDGVNWDGFDNNYGHGRAIGWGNGQFVSVLGNNIYTSVDGLSWTNRGSSLIGGFSGVAYNINYEGGKYFITGNGGDSLVSSDGINWTNINISNGQADYLYDVKYNGYDYLAIGDKGGDGTDRAKTYTSTDGINWVYQDAPNGSLMSSAVWDGSKYVAVGFYRIDVGIPVDPTSIPEPPPVINTSTTSNQTSSTVGNVITTIKTDTSISDIITETHSHSAITTDHTTTTTTTITTTTVTKDYVPNVASIKNIQAGANTGNCFHIELSDVRTNALGIADIKVDDSSNAQEALGKVDSALSIVSAERSKMGAFQNALEHISSNVTNSEANLTAAESRIRDLNMAKEMMEFTKNNILQQAAQAILAQANQQPQGILNLLK